MHIMLDITKEKVEKVRTYDMSPYFQILGFKRSASFLIGNIKRKSSIPMVRHLRVMNDPLSKDQEEIIIYRTTCQPVISYRDRTEISYDHKR